MKRNLSVMIASLLIMQPLASPAAQSLSEIIIRDCIDVGA
jgi:hypothetical protein